MQTQTKTRTLVQMAVLTAMSVLLVYLIHLPIIPAAPFLEYDPADVPILIGTFMLGPIGGLIITALACIVQGVTVSAASGIIGILMHFFATAAYAGVAGIIYKRNHTRKGAGIALAVGALAMVATMVIWNLIFTPIFMGADQAAVIAMMPFIVLFNVIKAVTNGIITFILYKPLSKVLRMTGGKTKSDVYVRFFSRTVVKI